MKKLKILVVDDELDMRTFITTLLETSGYRPIIAVNGEEGIQKAREKKPAAIILDVMMPKEGGIQMYRELKTDDELKEIPVIMLSAIAKKYSFLRPLLWMSDGRIFQRSFVLRLENPGLRRMQT